VQLFEQPLGEVVAAKFGGGGIDRDMAERHAAVEPDAHVGDHLADHAVADCRGDLEIFEMRIESPKALHAALCDQTCQYAPGQEWSRKGSVGGDVPIATAWDFGAPRCGSSP
jgi:hypothetical protein